MPGYVTDVRCSWEVVYRREVLCASVSGPLAPQVLDRSAEPPCLPPSKRPAVPPVGY